jgi:hypothetical protein
VWNFVKHPFLLRVKGLLASLKLIKISNSRWAPACVRYY